VDSAGEERRSSACDGWEGPAVRVLDPFDADRLGSARSGSWEPAGPRWFGWRQLSRQRPSVPPSEYSAPVGVTVLLAMPRREVQPNMNLLEYTTTSFCHR
jgi:hypothetical protein